MGEEPKRLPSLPLQSFDAECPYCGLEVVVITSRTAIGTFQNVECRECKETYQPVPKDN